MIASWTPWIVVSRSATIWEIDTFITLLSSTMTNCAAARIASANHQLDSRSAAPAGCWCSTALTGGSSARGGARAMARAGVPYGVRARRRGGARVSRGRP